MSTFAAEWALWMLPVVWQVTLLALGVFVADLLLRRVVWPQLLHALWLLVPLRLLLPPHLTSPVAVAPRVDTAIAGGVDPLPWFLAWACGIVALMLVAWRRRRILARLPIEPVPQRVDAAAESARGRLSLRRRVSVVCSPVLGSPAVHGWLRPRVILPSDLARTATPTELQHVLLHEFAHVTRGDLFVQWLIGVLNLLFWFHPLVWLARRRARALRELCCDATVASVLRDETPAYRATLLRAAARLLEPARPDPGLAGFLGGPALILARLRWLDREDCAFSRRRRVATAATIVLLAITAVPLAQARIVDPAIAELEAQLRTAEARVQTMKANPDSTGCLELRWSFLQWMALEEQRRAAVADGAEENDR